VPETAFEDPLPKRPQERASSLNSCRGETLKRSSGSADSVRMQVKRRRFEAVTSRLFCLKNSREPLHTKNVHQLSVLDSVSVALWRTEVICRRAGMWMKSRASISPDMMSIKF
jgi:hypothetical protein